MNLHRAARGFSLLELAVVIVISSVLLGGLLVPLVTRIEVQQVHDEQQTMADIRDTLLGYAQANGRLPCPDASGNGVEATAPCADSVGWLPFATLGVNSTDRWGRRYVYGVTGEMTNVVRTGEAPQVNALDLTDTGWIRVRERLDDKSTVQIAGDAAAVIVSLGANGFGGTDADGNAIVPPPGADELQNTNNDRDFITRVRSEGDDVCNDVSGLAPLCEFDDIVSIIPTPLLLGRLVQAGRLP